MDLRFSTLMWYHVHFLWEKWNTKRGENQKNTVGKISRFLPLNIHIFRPTDRVRINILNLCENEDSFLKSHHKVKNASSSISKWCISNDRHRRTIDVNFFCLCIRLRQVCLFSEQTGVFLSETDSERFLDSDESVCCSVSQRQQKILVPRKKVSGRSWWNTRRNTWKWILGTYIWRKYDHSTNLQNQIWITLDLSVQIMKYLDWSKSNIQVA